MDDEEAGEQSAGEREAADILSLVAKVEPHAQRLEALIETHVGQGAWVGGELADLLVTTRAFAERGDFPREATAAQVSEIVSVLRSLAEFASTPVNRVDRPIARGYARLLSNLRAALTEAKVHPDMTRVLALASSLAAVNVTRARTMDLCAQHEAALKHLGDRADAVISEYEDKLQKLYGSTVARAAANDFREEAKAIGFGERMWMSAAIALPVAATSVGVALGGTPGDVATWIARISVFAPLAVLEWFFLRNYGRARDLARDYRFKAVLLSTLDYFGREMNDPKNTAEAKQQLGVFFTRLASPPRAVGGETPVTEAVQALQALESLRPKPPAG